MDCSSAVPDSVVVSIPFPPVGNGHCFAHLPITGAIFPPIHNTTPLPSGDINKGVSPIPPLNTFPRVNSQLTPSSTADNHLLPLPSNQIPPGTAVVEQLPPSPCSFDANISCCGSSVSGLQRKRRKTGDANQQEEEVICSD